MKILNVSTFDSGGAGKSCVRQHKALLGQGVDSRLLTLHRTVRGIPEHYLYHEEAQALPRMPKATQPPALIRRVYKGVVNQLTNAHERNRLARSRDEERRQQLSETIHRASQQYEYYSTWNAGVDITKLSVFKEADIINLHWVADFLNVPKMFGQLAGKKVVWTLHDMNPFTGGCHYSLGCEKYVTGCTHCPQTLQTPLPKITESTYALKDAVYSSASINVVTPSRWLGECSANSFLFRGQPHTVIPNSIDTNVFRPVDRQQARAVLNFPQEDKIILFVSQSLAVRRKGFALLQESLAKIEYSGNLTVCTMGDWKGGDNLGHINHLSLGTVTDELLLSIVYSAADVFVFPSIEDNLPNVILESLSCGTPVVSYSIGGLKDLVIPSFNGILCQEVNSVSLAEGVSQFFKNEKMFIRTDIREDAINKFSPLVQANAYINLYKSLV